MYHKEIEIDDTTFRFPKWKLERVLANQGTVIGLVSEPLSLLVAGSDSYDEATILSTVVESLMERIASINMVKLAEDTLVGVQVQTKGKSPVDMLPLSNMDEYDLSVDKLITAIAAVIVINYGPLLKNGIGEKLTCLKKLMVA